MSVFKEKKYILALVTNAYTDDPRVRRECEILVRVGYSVCVLAWDRAVLFPGRELINGVNVIRIHVPSAFGSGEKQVLNLLRYWLACLWFSLRMQVDLVHCNDLDTVVPGYLVALIKNARCVFDAHEHFPSQMKNSSGRTAIRLAEKLEKYFTPKMDLVITVGQRLASLYKTQNAKKVAVVLNSRDKKDFEFSAELLAVWKLALRLTGYRLVVSAVGSMARGRRLEVLMEVAALRPDVGLILAGDGEMKAMAKDYSSRYPNIRYLGFVPEKLALILTCISDATYYALDSSLPNTYFSMPNRLFYALAAECPIIVASGVGEVGEVVAQHRLGPELPKVDFGSLNAALDQLIDRENMDMYRQNLKRAFVQEFSMQSSQVRLLEAYQELLR